MALRFKETMTSARIDVVDTEMRRRAENEGSAAVAEFWITLTPHERTICTNAKNGFWKPTAAQTDCNIWNAAHPVAGAPVFYQTSAGDHLDTFTRSAAVVRGVGNDALAVIDLIDITESVPLARVTPRTINNEGNADNGI